MLSEAFSAMQTDTRVRSEPLWAMQKSLAQKLEVGKLEACGVQSAPKQKRNLEVLPEHFFVDANINWAKNEVTNFGITYSAVRVRRLPSMTLQITTEKTLNVPADVSNNIRPKRAEQGSGEAIPAPAGFQSSALTQPADQETGEGQRRKPGPPSGAPAVIAAYKELLRNGVVKEGMNVTDVHRRLVRVLKSNTEAFPNGRGLAYASIARHLRSYLTGLSKFSS